MLNIMNSCDLSQLNRSNRLILTAVLTAALVFLCENTINSHPKALSLVSVCLASTKPFSHVLNKKWQFEQGTKTLWLRTVGLI